MKTSPSTKGQLVLPAELREQDGLKPGQQFEIQRLQRGKYLLKKISGTNKPGLVDLLLSCPEKGWFQGIPSESTADV